MAVRTSDIGLQIREFLREVLRQESPKWVVTVERKGTALLRALLDGAVGDDAACSWDKVLSSEALRYVPPSKLRGGTILLLEDAIRDGNTVDGVLKVLTEHKKVPRDRIRIASFSIHEGSQFGPVDHCWFGRLDDPHYASTRAAMLRFFQQKGSLLLDTEHVEVPVDINCGRADFFDALSKGGIGVEHVSGAGLANLTVYNPLIQDKNEFFKHLPLGTSCTDVVCKIRAVERGANRYAILPMCYPSTRRNLQRKDFPAWRSGHRWLWDLLSDKDPEKSFHLTAMYAAVHLFRTVGACLRDLVAEEKVSISVPLPGDPDDSLSHLHALFPSLPVNELHADINSAIEAGRTLGIRRSKRKRGFISADRGSKLGTRLEAMRWLALSEVLRVSHRVPGELLSDDEDGGNDRERSRRLGASLAEILQVVRQSDQPAGEQEIDEAILSAAIDRAIDDAQLVTDVQTLPFSDGEDRLVRVFRLDGELVTSDMQMAAALWQHPTPPEWLGERYLPWI